MGWLTKRLRCGASSSCGATSAAKSVEDTASAPVEDTASAPITTLVFDIDDTLYDVGCGFTEHRNGGAVFSFMVKKLGFKNAAAAKVVRDEYFYRYHATAKGLMVAEQEGRLPKKAHFKTEELAEWWATKLEFDKFLSPDPEVIDALRTVPLKLVAFTNGPRQYALRVLESIGLRDLFEVVFAVDDVLPACKPEPAAFEKVFATLGVRAENCVMIEDSMKNVRAAKELGMRTVLITGKGDHLTDGGQNLGKGDDLPRADDPAVDVAIRTVGELKARLPGLWATPAVFS